jgi:aminopeptidase N
MKHLLRRTLQRSVQIFTVIPIIGGIQTLNVIPTIGGICSSLAQKFGRCLLRRHDIKLSLVILLLILFTTNFTLAQLLKNKPTFTKADTLRGSLNENRDWWDVLRYDITVKPDYEKKEIEGKVTISFKSNFLSKETLTAIKQKKISAKKLMQIDLQAPLTVDSVINSYTTKVLAMTTDRGCIEKQITRKNVFKFSQNNNTCLIEFPSISSHVENNKITIYYHGKPIEAKTPPWDGGWIWKKDKNGNPWMSVAVQGLGASAWYPCKDYQGDEPDNGASLTMIVPDSLKAIANGRFTSTESLTRNEKLETKYTWEVKNPINNYCIVPYIGKYVNFTDTFMGENGKLNLNYWVLDYNLEKAKEQFKQVKPMLKAFEYWFGPYPFYEDDFKLVDAPHLGMEHQSAIAYGNQYKNGYLGSDRSGKTGWGLKWDFIIVHESGHEWFANNITAKDIADMWIHEAFTTYSETLFTEFYYGQQAANEYNYGQRRNIRNKEPMIGTYGVNKEGSGDMYDKGSNMIHTLRHAMNDDKKFRAILRGLNKTFWHKTVTTKDIEEYISKQAGFNFQQVFNQYLRTVDVPVFEYSIDDQSQKLHFKYSNCIDGFNLPIWLNIDGKAIQLKPSNKNSSINFNNKLSIQKALSTVEFNYYLAVKEVAQL